MGSTFNPQILVEKLTKLNNSQQSIETLSHWCIFHMNKAKLVVETWDRQFHSSPREQRLAFLYLANDILQNSRRKGAEFVAEFWRVLPEALRDVIRNGDETGRTSALRLITIWDERKVFGSRGHILKEEFMGKQPENSVNKSGRQLSIKLRQSIGNMLDKIVSDYETIYGGQLDEDALLSRCTNSISYLDKLIKDIGGGMSSGSLSGTGFSEELHGQHAALKECIEQLTTLESSRASLISHLRDALQEQELKLDQVRSQLQAAQSRSDQVANVYRQSVSSDSNMLLDEQGGKEAHASTGPPGFNPVDRQVNPVVYTRQAPTPDKAASADDDSRKSAAAAVAAKLTASTASAEMLSHVLTSLVSGVAFGNNSQESSGDPHHSEKRPKLENESASYTPPPPPPPPPQSQQPPPPLPPFPHPESLIQNANSTPTNTQSATGEQPPLPSSSPPPLPPLPPMAPYQMAPQFIQTAGSMSNVAYSYGATQQPPPPPLPGYPSVGVSVTGMSPYGPPPVNPYQPFPSSDGGFYSPSSPVPMAPISRQQTL